MKLKKLFLLYLVLVAAGFCPLPASADFTWRFVGGDPRGKPIQTAEEAVDHFLSPKGESDLRRHGFSQAEIDTVKVLVRNQGVDWVIIRKVLGTWQISWDYGRTWRPVELNGLTFSHAGVYVPGPIRLAWVNVDQAIGYYPKGMLGRVPMVIAACRNMGKERPPTPPVTVRPPPAEIPPPYVSPPPPPLPGAPAYAYQAPGQPSYILSQTYLAAVTYVPQQPTNIQVTSSNVNSNVNLNNNAANAAATNNNQSQTIVPVNTVVNTGSGAAAGTSNGAGSQTINP